MVALAAAAAGAKKVRAAHAPRAGRFDVKHSPGGMMDAEFAVQFLVAVKDALPNGTVKKGDAPCVVDSVKAASDVYAPVSGTVTDANAALADEPELVNSDPENGGWLFRLTLSDPSELDGLMDKAAYDAYVAGL